MQAAVRSGKAKKVLVSGSGSKHTSKDLFWEASLFIVGQGLVHKQVLRDIVERIVQREVNRCLFQVERNE